MSYFQFMVWLFASVGATLVLTQSALFDRFRNLFDPGKEKRHLYWDRSHDLHFRDKLLTYLHKLVTCPMCAGVYVGIVLYFLVPLWWFEPVAYGLVASLFSYTAYRLLD